MIIGLLPQKDMNPLSTIHFKGRAASFSEGMILNKSCQEVMNISERNRAQKAILFFQVSLRLKFMQEKP